HEKLIFDEITRRLPRWTNTRARCADISMTPQSERPRRSPRSCATRPRWTSTHARSCRLNRSRPGLISPPSPLPGYARPAVQPSPITASRCPTLLRQCGRSATEEPAGSHTIFILVFFRYREVFLNFMSGKNAHVILMKNGHLFRGQELS